MQGKIFAVHMTTKGLVFGINKEHCIVFRKRHNPIEKKNGQSLYMIWFQLQITFLERAKLWRWTRSGACGERRRDELQEGLGWCDTAVVNTCRHCTCVGTHRFYSTEDEPASETLYGLPRPVVASCSRVATCSDVSWAVVTCATRWLFNAGVLRYFKRTKLEWQQSHSRDAAFTCFIQICFLG